MLGRIKRPASGALAYDYLCPGGPYDEQWDWDGFFMGVGLAARDARDALYLRNWCLNFILNAAPDGHTPGVMTPAGRDPRLNHMKPFLAQGAYLASRFMGDFAWITPHYERLRTVVDYRERHLWNREHDLGLWFNAMESGADNNPAFTAADCCTVGADLNTFIQREYTAMAAIAAQLGRSADAARYRDRAQAVRTGIQSALWSEQDNTYYNLDASTGAHMRTITYSNFVPLWAGLASPGRGESQIRRYLVNPLKMWSPWGGRTLAADDPGYNNVNMIKPFSNWQGPVWPIANYLYLHALLNYGFDQQALDLARRVMQLCLDDILASGGMHENYDAETGQPLAAPGFVSWNVLVCNMLDEATTGRDPFKLL